MRLTAKISRVLAKRARRLQRLVRWHVHSNGLNELNLEVAHACVGLVIHVHESSFLARHFSNYNNRTEFLVLTSRQLLNRKDLGSGSLNRIQVCLHLIEQPSRIIHNRGLQIVDVMTQVIAKNAFYINAYHRR